MDIMYIPYIYIRYTGDIMIVTVSHDKTMFLQ